MLTDTFSRRHTYLRLSVTDRCNLRCSYCMPPEGVELISHDAVLRNEEFVRVAGIFVGMGISKVRFTGGEPFARRGFAGIYGELGLRYPKLDMCVTTNGTLLRGRAGSLRAAGVRRINVSLDSLTPAVYRVITGVDCMDAVVSGIEYLLRERYFIIKINAVLMENTLEELPAMLEFAGSRGIALRFIERMPYERARPEGRFVPSSMLVERLGDLGALRRDERSDTEVAMMYGLDFRGVPVNVGVIPPVSHKFCASCNRLRVSSDGRLRTCLRGEPALDIKSALRRGAGDDEIAELISRAVKTKGPGHSIGCDSDDGGCASAGDMVRIGG